MFSTMSLTEAGCAALLCLYAISASRGADPIVPDATQRYATEIARANARYQAAQAVCEARSAGQQDLCFREAKATLLRRISDAKASNEPAVATRLVNVQSLVRR